MKTLGNVLVGSAIFVAGYFVGFYEMKYKTMKCLLEAEISKKDEKEESQ